MSIANYENMLSNAERRAVRVGLKQTVARISDLGYIAASSRGKLELNMTEEAGNEDKLIGRIVDEAIKNVFDQHLKPASFKNVVDYFEAGNAIEVGDRLPGDEYADRIGAIRDFPKQVAGVAGGLDPELAKGPFATELSASVAELILEGLHCHNRINRVRKSGNAKYG
jgi:magnesium chelatase subunit I